MKGKVNSFFGGGWINKKLFILLKELHPDIHSPTTIETHLVQQKSPIIGEKITNPTTTQPQTWLSESQSGS